MNPKALCEATISFAQDFVTFAQEPSPVVEAPKRISQMKEEARNVNRRIQSEEALSSFPNVSRGPFLPSTHQLSNFSFSRSPSFGAGDYQSASFPRQPQRQTTYPPTYSSTNDFNSQLSYRQPYE